MPRLARSVCARVPHHITQRGNRREPVFFTHTDGQAYLGWLHDYAERKTRATPLGRQACDYAIRRGPNFELAKEKHLGVSA